MDSLPNELALVLLLGVTAALLAGCWRLSAHTAGADWSRRMLDTLLWFAAAQYLAGTVPGCLGILRAETILLTGAVVAGVAWWLGGRGKEPAPSAIPGEDRRWASWPVAVCCFVVVSLMTAISTSQGAMPPQAVDTLIYHFAAPVQWLQDGRLSLFETWHHNPANTWSPLGGSVLALWWYAPLGNDLLARFVQAPGLLLLFFACVVVARELGAGPVTAGLIGLGVVIARPFSVQLIVAKDDALPAAFFISAAAALAPSQLAGRAGPWRLGAALGLFFATKYTTLYSLPLLLLAADAPVRARWCGRRYAILFGLVALLAGPWYLRNAITTGNPLFPMRMLGLPGILALGRAPEFSSLAGIRDVMVEGYYSLRWPVALVLVLGWVTAALIGWRRLGGWPLERLVVIGAAGGVAILLLLAPYPELRFAHPAVALCALSVAMIEQRGRWGRGAAVGLAALMAAGALFSAIPSVQWPLLLPMTVAMMMVLGVASGVLVLTGWNRKAKAALATVGGLALAGAIYVHWAALCAAAVALEGLAWQQHYGPLAEGWLYIRENAAPGSVVALANSSSVYPLQGRGGQLRVVHVSAQPGVDHLAQLPPISGTLKWREVNLAVWHATYANAEASTWLENLRRSEARYLVIAKADPTGTGQAPPPPELQWAADAAGWRLAMENDAVAVWERVEP